MARTTENPLNPLYRKLEEQKQILLSLYEAVKAASQQTGAPDCFGAILMLIEATLGVIDTTSHNTNPEIVNKSINDIQGIINLINEKQLPECIAKVPPHEGRE